jgi:hypothetical protein
LAIEILECVFYSGTTFLLQSIQTGPGRHSASNPMGTQLSVLRLAAEM